MYDHAIILICIINVQDIKRAIDASWDVKISKCSDMKHPTRKHQYILNVKKKFKTGDSFFRYFCPYYSNTCKVKCSMSFTVFNSLSKTEFFSPFFSDDVKFNSLLFSLIGKVINLFCKHDLPCYNVDKSDMQSKHVHDLYPIMTVPFSTVSAVTPTRLSINRF